MLNWAPEAELRLFKCLRYFPEYTALDIIKTIQTKFGQFFSIISQRHSLLSILTALQ